MPSNQIVFNQQQIDDIKRLAESIRDLAKNGLRRPVRRTIISAKAQIAKEISAKTTLKSTYIKNCISSTVEITTDNGVSGKIIVSSGFYRNNPSYWNPLAKFSFSQLKKGGVNVRVYKGGTVQKFRHAFVPRLRSGHIGIFVTDYDASGNVIRTSTGRPRIKELVGPAVSQIYQNQPGLAQQVETDAAENLINQLNQQLTYLLSRP